MSGIDWNKSKTKATVSDMVITIKKGAGRISFDLKFDSKVIKSHGDKEFLAKYAASMLGL